MAPPSPPNFRLGLLLLAFYVLICVVQNELYSSIQRGDPDRKAFDHAFFIVWWNHSFMAFGLPPVLIYLSYCRRRQHADVGGGTITGGHRSSLGDPLVQAVEPFARRDGGISKQRRGPGLGRATAWLASLGLSWRRLMWTAVWCGLLFLGFNWLWFLGLPMPGMLPSMAAATANSSFAFVYILSLLCLGDPFDAIKAAAVLACLGGVACLAISSTAGQAMHFSTGILVEAGTAVGQAIYLVAFRRWGIRKGELPVEVALLIAGFEGLAHLLLFWPVFILLDLTGVEPFAWPGHKDLVLLTAGATMAASGNLALMAGLALMPSPLVVSVATLLTAPTQFVADCVLHPAATKHVSVFEVVGGLLVIASFAVVIWRDERLARRRRRRKEEEEEEEEEGREDDVMARVGGRGGAEGEACVGIPRI